MLRKKLFTDPKYSIADIYCTVFLERIEEILILLDKFSPFIIYAVNITSQSL